MFPPNLRCLRYFKLLDKILGSYEQTFKTFLSLSQRFPETRHLNGFPRSITMGFEQLTAVRMMWKFRLLLDHFLNETTTVRIYFFREHEHFGENRTIWQRDDNFIAFHSISWHLVLLVFSESDVTQWTEGYSNRKCCQRKSCPSVPSMDLFLVKSLTHVNQDIVTNCWRNLQPSGYIKMISKWTFIVLAS